MPSLKIKKKKYESFQGLRGGPGLVANPLTGLAFLLQLHRLALLPALSTTILQLASKTTRSREAATAKAAAGADAEKLSAPVLHLAS